MPQQRRSQWDPAEVEERDKLTVYEQWEQEPGFSMKGGIEATACEMVFRDRWSEACKRCPDTPREPVETLLYREGWNGHWPTLMKQIHSYTLTLKHPILFNLWLISGMFFLMWGRVAKAKPENYWVD